MKKKPLKFIAPSITFIPDNAPAYTVERATCTISGKDFILTANCKTLSESLLFGVSLLKKKMITVKGIEFGSVPEPQTKHDPFQETVDNLLESELSTYRKETQRLRTINNELRLQTARFAYKQNNVNVYFRHVQTINNCSGLSSKAILNLFLILNDVHAWHQAKKKNIEVFALMFPNHIQIPHFTGLLAACRLVDYELKINQALYYIDEYYNWLKFSPDSPAYCNPPEPK